MQLFEVISFMLNKLRKLKKQHLTVLLFTILLLPIGASAYLGTHKNNLPHTVVHSPTSTTTAATSTSSSLPSSSATPASPSSSSTPSAPTNSGLVADPKSSISPTPSGYPVLPCGVQGIDLNSQANDDLMQYNLRWQAWGNKSCPGEAFMIIWIPTSVTNDEHQPPAGGGTITAGITAGYADLPFKLLSYSQFTYTVKVCSTRPSGPCSQVITRHYFAS